MAQQKDRLLGGERDEGAKTEENMKVKKRRPGRGMRIGILELKLQILLTGNEKRSWNTPGCIYKNVIFSR